VFAHVHDLVPSLLEHFGQGVFSKAAQMCQFVGVVCIKVGHFHQQKAAILQQVGPDLFQCAQRVFEVFEHVHHRYQVKLTCFTASKLFEGGIKFEAFLLRQLAVSITRFHADHFGSIGFVDGLH